MATLASLVVDVKANTAGLTSGMRNASRGTDALRRNVLRLGAAFGAALGARQLLRGIQSIGRAFTIQEDAVEGLRASLIATGKDGTSSLELLTRSAAELQKVTRAGDEAIISATASLAQLAPALDTAQLEKAQSAIIGIAETFTKGDLESAAQLIGKSVGSTTNALTRYGIELDTSATATEKMAAIVEQSAVFFDVAKARALTTGGAMQQLVNAFGDVKESIGQMLATRTGFTQFLQRVTTTLADIATILSGSSSQIKRMFGLVGIIAANAYSEALLSGLAKTMDNAIQTMAGMPMLLVAELIVWADQLQEIFSRSAAEAGANIEGSVLELGEMANKIRKLAPAVSAGTEQGITRPIINKLSELEDAGKSAGESLIRGFIQGTDNLGALLVATIKNIAISLITKEFNKALGISSPSTVAALAGRNTVLGYIKGLKDAAPAISGAVSGAFALAGAPAGAGAGGGTIVHQEIHFNAGFVDGGSGQAWLKANGGTIAQIIFDAAQDGAGFRRGLRGR